MSQQKAARQIAKKLATEAADGVGDLGSGRGAVGGAAGRAAKKGGKKKPVKRLSIFDRNNTEGLFYKSGALKKGARDAVPEAVRSLLQSPDGAPTLGDLSKKELRALHQELVATGNDNLANNLVQRTDAKNWKTSEIKQAENAQPLPDDGSDVLAKGNPDANELNNTTGKPRKRNVSDVKVTKPDGTEVKAVDSNTFRKQDRPLPEDDLYQQYVSNGIKDVDLKNQLDALFKSPGLQTAYRADRGLDETASIFSQGRILSDDYKAWILERAGDGGVDFFNKAYASGKQTVPRRNAVTPKNRYDKVTTANEKGVSSASKLAGADVGAPESSQDFARRATTEGDVDPTELPGATPTASGRKQATLPTDAKRQMGVEDLVQGIRDEARPEALRIIADGSDVESSEMAYEVVEAFLNRRIPTGDRVSETAHRAAVQAGADALAASLNRPPYKELHPSILDANNAATRIDIESGKQPVKGQPVEAGGGAGNTVTPGSRAGALNASQTAEMGNARQRNALIRQVAAEQGLEPNDVNRLLRSNRMIQVKDAEGNLIEVPQANAESLYILASRGQDLMDWDAHAKIQQQLATGTFPTNKDGAGFADGTSLGDGTPKNAATDATVTQQPQVAGPGEMFGPPGTKFDPANNVLHRYLAESENGIKDQAAFNRFLADTTDAQKADVVSEAKQAGFVNETPKGPSKKKLKELEAQKFPGDEDAPPVWEDGSLKKDAKKATNALKDDPELLDPVPEDLGPKTKKAAPKPKPEVRDPSVERAAKNPAQLSAAEDWLAQNGIDVEGFDDYEIMETFFDNYKVGDAAPEAPKGTKAKKTGGNKQTEQPVEEPLEGTTEPSLEDNRKAFTTANLRKYVEQKLVDNGMSKADAKKFVKKMDRNQLIEEYEISGGRSAVGRMEQYPGRTPQDAGAGTSPRPTGLATVKGADSVDTNKYPDQRGLTQIEVRPTDTGKYNTSGAKRTKRDYEQGRDFDGDTVDAAKKFDDTRKTHEKAIAGTAIGTTALAALAAWMMSQGMTGDDSEASTLSDGIGTKDDNPAMELGPDPGGRKGPAAGTGAGGAGMSRLERIRAAQGDRYVAGLPSTRPVRGY